MYNIIFNTKIDNATCEQMTNKEHIKALRNWAKENLVGKTVCHTALAKEITFTNCGIKEYLNQPHKYYYEKNEMIKNIVEVLAASVYKGNAVAHNNRYAVSHIFETNIAGTKSWLIVREYTNKNVVLYSVSDNESILSTIK